jgi:hypothetical protein
MESVQYAVLVRQSVLAEWTDSLLLRSLLSLQTAPHGRLVAFVVAQFLEHLPPVCKLELCVPASENANLSPYIVE